MLFTYPTEALACNWVNPKVIEALIGGMDAIDAGNAPRAWPDSLPADKREALRRRTGLRAKLEVFWNAYTPTPLSLIEKESVHSAITRQTNLPNLFSDITISCPCFEGLPAAMQSPVKTLADYLFRQLGEIKEEGKALRDVQFETLQQEGVRICPFCGLNYFQPVGLKRNALDHLMPISRYPFVSADFKNLPPTCHACNSLYKLGKDILFDDNGVRRYCSDPYVGPAYRINLDGSAFGEGDLINGYTLPRWQVNFDGPTVQQAETWDAVYQIKLWYIATLNADFLSWISHFSLWFVRQIGRGKTANDVSSELPRYIDNVIQDGLEDRSFLKSEAFRLVERSCSDPASGNDVKEWLWNHVKHAT